MRFLKYCLFTILILLSVEAILQIAYRKTRGYWLMANVNNPGLTLNQWNPYLVGSLKPDARFIKRPIPFFSKDTKKPITYSNNSFGARGEDVPIAKPPNIKRIVALGGSTTYCLGVSDNETWPALLEKRLGPKWQVINLGLCGYCTVENLIQTALTVGDLSPNYAIYYEGWNDLRNAHVKDLAGDYSNSNGAWQYYNLNIGAMKFGEWSASLVFLKDLLGKTFFRRVKFNPIPSAHAFTGKIDQRALALYARNLQSIIVLCKSQNIEPIFVPQVLNYKECTGSAPNGTVPFVPAKDIQKNLEVYNQKMRDIAAANNIPFIADILTTPFDQSDFWDVGHLNEKGNEIFAKIVSNFIKRISD